LLCVEQLGCYMPWVPDLTFLPVYLQVHKTFKKKKKKRGVLRTDFVLCVEMYGVVTCRKVHFNVRITRNTCFTPFFI
jgi:hypothetical protein